MNHRVVEIAISTTRYSGSTPSLDISHSRGEVKRGGECWVRILVDAKYTHMSGPDNHLFFAAIAVRFYRSPNISSNAVVAVAEWFTYRFGQFKTRIEVRILAGTSVATEDAMFFCFLFFLEY
jgi:hypothetical protein